MIQGVEIKKLVSHENDGGFFVELMRASDPFFQNSFGQLSHSMSLEGTIKAWHLHHKQTDWMYVALGEARIGLFDLRKGSPTHRELMLIESGERSGRVVVKVPPGVAHGYKVLQGPMHMIYVMNKEYDPADIEELNHDDPSIGYDWSV